MRRCCKLLSLLVVLPAMMLVAVVKAAPGGEHRQNDQESLSQLSQQIDAQRHRIVQLEAQLRAVGNERRALERRVTQLSWEHERLCMQYTAVVRNVQLHRAATEPLPFLLSARSWRQMLSRARFLNLLYDWRKNFEQHIIDSKIQRRKASDRLQRIERECRTNMNLCRESQRQLNVAVERLSGLTENRAFVDEKRHQVSALAARFSQAMQQLTAVPTSERASASHSRLTFPVEGQYRIVGHYGRHRHPSLRYVTIENNGIDIECATGGPAQAVAVATGMVTAIYHHSDDDYVVMLRHDGYMSVYAGLKTVTVKQRQRVPAGEHLGSVGSDAVTGKPLLHYELRRGHEKLNPTSFF